MNMWESDIFIPVNIPKRFNLRQMCLTVISKFIFSTGGKNKLSKFTINFLQNLLINMRFFE
ncbi:MAG: hypothetical protein D8H94_00650 [Cardiobacterium sp.]|nr:MAG: hypothetical protein D8H94_00650 [Cardiobacterium sp.]